ncbi:hypothetical protein Sipo8835_00730 [Streptomyces ipomoeae]|uniref:Uncharacterized protein n=1 Tax=Streptomyces ipomoeae TaxID=103232 RepID=A0AAE9B341_9ACTN|nr:hypothetical protein Sipo8835_00730 [Streptomyces ipomoeae]
MTKIKSVHQRLRMSTGVTYRAALSFGPSTVECLSRLLGAERHQRHTRKKIRLLTLFRQAVLVLRWFAAAKTAGRGHLHKQHGGNIQVIGIRVEQGHGIGLEVG